MSTIVTVLYKSARRANSATLNTYVEDVNSIVWPSDYASAGRHLLTSVEDKAIAMAAIVRSGAVEVGRKANQVRFTV